MELALGTMILYFLVYFIPTGLAMLREHKNTASILVVNIFLGWTLIGWVVALAMAAMPTPQSIVTKKKKQNSNDCA